MDPRLGRTLGDYARPVYNQGLSSVRPPPIAANNFGLKQCLLQAIQNNCVFRGKTNEYPNTHLMDFEEIMNTFKYNEVSKDAVYLTTFPFSLEDDAKHWLRSLPTRSIRTWEDKRSLIIGGPLMKKTPEKIVAILDELSEDANQWPVESNDRRKSAGIQ
ncbi:uncharacterized protein [Nicotiana tomentosiformis]|uniref:uncharacterized protein n=1 Tax=Nicotiana tomentosiformis TaxID=4098 RepID=UPI000878DD99|nr:uncharacterized protein LOC108943109 [Nicotiana tomentosiformis]